MMKSVFSHLIMPSPSHSLCQNAFTTDGCGCSALCPRQAVWPTRCPASKTAFGVGQNRCYVKKFTYDVIFFTYDVIFFT